MWRALRGLEPECGIAQVRATLELIVHQRRLHGNAFVACYSTQRIHRPAVVGGVALVGCVLQVCAHQRF